MNISKLVIKGTAKISLHERFTQLSKFQVSSSADWDPDYVRGSGGGGVTKAGISRYGQGASTNYREPSPEVRMNPALRRPASMPSYRERSVEAERMDRMLYRPSAAVTAAAKIKRKSIHQRLGVRARLSMPSYTPYMPYRPGGGIGARLGVRRWASTDSLADNKAPRRRWSGFNYRRRGGYLKNGNRRFGYGGFRNRNRWGQGRGRFNRGRGRGSRGRRQQGPPPSREQLDKEIDSYMAGTKGILDKEIDEYMMETANV